MQLDRRHRRDALASCPANPRNPCRPRAGTSGRPQARPRSPHRRAARPVNVLSPGDESDGCCELPDSATPRRPPETDLREPQRFAQPVETLLGCDRQTAGHIPPDALLLRKRQGRAPGPCVSLHRFRVRRWMALSASRSSRSLGRPDSLHARPFMRIRSSTDATGTRAEPSAIIRLRFHARAKPLSG